MARQQGDGLLSLSDKGVGISGTRVKRPALDKLMADARRGLSLAQLAKTYSTSRATVHRVLRQANGASTKTLVHTRLHVVENALAESAD